MNLVEVLFLYKIKHVKIAKDHHNISLVIRSKYHFSKSMNMTFWNNLEIKYFISFQFKKRIRGYRLIFILWSENDNVFWYHLIILKIVATESSSIPNVRYSKGTRSEQQAIFHFFYWNIIHTILTHLFDKYHRFQCNVL